MFTKSLESLKTTQNLFHVYFGIKLIVFNMTWPSFSSGSLFLLHSFHFPEQIMTNRETDRKTEDRKTEKLKDRKREQQKDRMTERKKERKNNRKTERQKS